MGERVTRRDSGALAKPEITSDGFLRVEGTIASPCILEYENPDGSTRHELLDAANLFDPVSVRSFSVLPLTNTHPTDLLTPDTVAAHQVGTVGEPRRDGDRLVSVLGVLTSEAIAAVQSGRAQLSCGYSAELDETPGEHPTLKCAQCGTNKYDGIQKDRRGNHIAVVDEARVGPNARIRLDSSGNACIVSGNSTIDRTEIAPMPEKIKVGSHRFDANDASVSLIQQAIDAEISAATARTDAATAATAAAERVRADTAARLDAFTARATAFTARLKAHRDAMMKRNVVCDECMGEKNIDGAKCPSCDGMGTVSARDAMKSMAMPDDAPTPDEDMDDMPVDMPMDESPAAPVAAAIVEKRKDARRAAQVKRRDSLARIADRRAVQIAALHTAAAKHLDSAEIKGADTDIMRAVLVKIAPHLDAAAMDPASVRLFFAAETKRTDSAPSPSAVLTQSTLPARADANTLNKYAAADAAAMQPWALPAGKA